MPKKKTKRSAMKRLKVTGSGRVKRKKAFGTHNFGSKTRKRKRSLRKSEMMRKEDSKRILSMVTA